jgi:hypothetical protein
MKSIFRVLVVAVMMGVAGPVLACLPLPPELYANTEKRVRERFDSVDSVVLVTLLEVRKVKKKELGIDLDGEKTTFRVDRIFKGRSKPGDRLILYSYSTCSRTVAELGYGPDGPVKLSRQWLIYRNESDKTELRSSDMTRPINFASYDLKVLRKVVRTGTNKKPQ